MSILLETLSHGDVRLIRFLRPELRNPLSKAVLSQLEKLINEFENDKKISGVIFTGSGNAFASGADLREIAAINVIEAADFARRGQRLMSAISGLRCPTIAAINGFCFGGALDLALSCDQRIAAPEATFAHPGTSLGIITGWSGTQRLPRLIGTANASEMFFTAEPIDAHRAMAIGLIDEINDDAAAAALARFADNK